MTQTDIETEIRVLKERIQEVERYAHTLEEMIDTLWTPPWKKMLFWLDGWPLYRVVEARSWRPWHRKGTR